MTTTSANSVPYSPEAEQGALACCLLKPTHAGDLASDWFYALRHRLVAEAMLDLAVQGKPISEATLLHHLTASGNIDKVGGAAFLSDLPSRTGHSGEFNHWRGILLEKSTLRRILVTAAEATLAVQGNGCATSDEILDQYERDVLAIRQARGREYTARDLMAQVIDYLDDCHQHKGRPRGVLTGFADLDWLTNGLADGELLVIGARPSIGKTSLAMNIGEKVAVNDGVAVGVFSLEMSAKSLMLRMTCARARVDSMAAQRGGLDEQEFRRLAGASSQISKAPLFIDDAAGVTVGQLCARARRIKQRHGIKLLVVDYIQLIKGGQRRSENRNAEMTEVANGIQQLAKELAIPIIACSQLNRSSDNEKRPPRLSDLRESGSLEQAADLVLLLHRPEDAFADVEQIGAELGKNRNGPIGRFLLTFFRKFTRFENVT